MAVVILIILLCIGIYFIHIYIMKEERMNEHYRELSKFVDDKEICNEYARESIKEIHPGHTRNRYIEPTIKQIRKYFKTHPDKLAEAENNYKEQKERAHYNRESWKKFYIMDRIFAYDYEDLLFQIYSKVAVEDSRGKWVARVHLKNEDLINEICRIRKVDRSEAGRIIHLLCERCIISEICGGYLLSSLLQDFGGGELWPWNIVSDTDMNLDKWMVAHGYEHKKN